MSARGDAVPAASASTHIATANPSMSLSGRSDVNQKSGHAATTSTVHAATLSRPSSLRKNRKIAGSASAPPIALQMASPRGAGASTPTRRSDAVDALASAM